MQTPHLSFKILALAPFSPTSSTAWSQPPMPVDRTGLDEAVKELNARLFLPLDTRICAAGGIEIHFDGLKAFHPDGVAKTNPFLAHLQAASEFVNKGRKQDMPAAAIADGLRQWPDLPVMEISDKHRRKPSHKASDALDNLFDMVALPDQPLDLPDSKPAVAANPYAILLQSTLDALFNQPAFRQMEAAWRGLRLLLQQGQIDDAIKVEIVPVSHEILDETLEKLTATLVNDLPGVILLDLPFSNTPAAIEQLTLTAQWAATLMVPVITWVHPEFLHIASWDELKTLPFIPHHIEGTEYAKYRKLKESNEGQWVCLNCNRFLTRYPYGPENKPRNVDFAETGLLWISPVWASGALIAQSVCRTGWPTKFTDRNTFTIQDLALFKAANHPPRGAEALFDRDRMDQLIRAGLSPLAFQSDRDFAFLPKSVSTSGKSLAYQLLVSQVMRFILWCKDNLPAETNPAMLGTQLKMAFQVFSEQSKPFGFEQIDISTGQPNPEGKIPVQIRVIPAAAILPSREPIEMALDW